MGNHEEWQRARLRTLALSIPLNWSVHHIFDRRRDHVLFLVLLLLNRLYPCLRFDLRAFMPFIAWPLLLPHLSMIRLIVSLYLQRRALAHLCASSIEPATIFLRRDVLLPRVCTSSIPIGWLLGLAIFILPLACRLHLLNQVRKEFLELLILLPNLYNLRFNHVNPCGISSDLILNFKDFFEDDLSDLIEALHVSLLWLILLESELTFDFIVRWCHHLLDTLLEVVHALSHGLI